MITPSTRVLRRQIIEGYSIPAFINNGGHCFVNLDVYEDGRVQCWNFKDFEHFKKDVQRNWVSFSIPNYQSISIVGLGEWIIHEANWLFNKDSFIEYVENVIKMLNPNLENIYKYTERKNENGIIYSQNGHGTVFKEKRNSPLCDIFAEIKRGNGHDFFYKIRGDFYLVSANVFSDGSIHLSRLENPVELTLNEFEILIRKKVLVSRIRKNSNVIIYGLGSFKIHKALYYKTINEKLVEIKNDLERFSKRQKFNPLLPPIN